MVKGVEVRETHGSPPPNSTSGTIEALDPEP